MEIAKTDILICSAVFST